MRKLALLFGITMFFAPIFAFGASSDWLKKLCPNGLTGNPPGRQTFPLDTITEESTANALKEYTRKVTCSNACFDSEVSIKISVEMVQGGDSAIALPRPVVVLDTKKINRCNAKATPTAQDAKAAGRGCDTKNQPQISIALPSGEKKGPKSRCYEEISTAINGAFSSLKNGDFKGVSSSLASLDKLGTEAPLVTDLDTRVSQPLADAFGADVAQQIVSSGNSAEAEAALKSGKKEDIEKVLERSGVVITDDVRDKIARLAPPSAGSTDDAGSGGSDGTRPDSTFPSPDDRNNLSIDPTGQPSAQTRQWRDARGQLAEAVDPNVLGSLTADAQRRICGTVQNCYVTPEAQFATMARETDGDVRNNTGDRGCSYSLAQANACQSGWGTFLSRYERVYGEPYLLHTTDLKNPSMNPEWIASQSARMQAVILQSKGEQVGGDFGRLLAAYNGSGYAAAVYGNGALRNAYALQSGSANQYWQAAYNSALAAVGTGPTITNLAAANIPSGGVTSVSPFGNVNPFLSASPVGYSSDLYSNYISPGTILNQESYCVTSTQPLTIYRISAGTPYPSNCYNAPGVQSVQAVPNFTQPLQPMAQPIQQFSPQPVSSQILPQGGVISGGTSTATPSLIQPVAALIVQPKEVSRGTPIVVSWSSVGMRASPPCQVFAELSGVSALIGQGSEGTRQLPTGATTTPGVWNFTLQCVALWSGSLVEQKTSAIVH
ncbi:hypothetical protein A2853_02235 [Candidatus Kaiserbacteria bacterium RIFCSPHIGHO2_01_FULL_55_17]|uniref:Uncharacterized protein n=1 Tax=Candidatus Kaiserbacteria bacterium RIFCSPHIGHO2_01_FULL_55_17 TaxID=1798484 RepID=A0A1F6D7C3_9BACT|nr:MAG: hypothetical protein A2853_02235 [Candidatus Kaiserbacteria bacterium RIFCSPHIGHO2_01_FULL_55_17]